MSNTINIGGIEVSKFYLGGSSDVKIYLGTTKLYPHLQEPCFAVVADISQYSDRTYVDVYNQADDKWYKLNNLNQYEEYGVYGSGRTITYYNGKLTIDDGYEYQYSGGSWVNVGEVSGGTGTLPNVPFTVNYNAKNYNSITNTLPKTSGQLADVDAVITAGTPTVGNGYITIASGTRASISGYQTYFNRDNNNANLTIISKQYTNGNNCHMFANRDTNYNWMYRCYATKLTLHGSSEQGSVAVTTQPVIESVRVASNRLITYNNYTDNTTTSRSNFAYGSTNNGSVGLFAGYGSSGSEWFTGDFYWVYMSQNTLTDEQVQQVINYNEGTQQIYPIYYDEIQDPPNNLTFSSMTEAESYECPWVGMVATIDGDRYIFSGDSQSGYEWVYSPILYKTLQELINTYPTEGTQPNNRFTNYSDVSGITYFRFYPSKGTSQSSYVYADHNSDNATGTTKFAIKADTNGSFYSRVGRYNSIKEAADSSSCTWAYWVDADTIEVNVVEAVGTTIYIKQWQTNFVTDIIAYKFG